MVELIKSNADNDGEASVKKNTVDRLTSKYLQSWEQSDLAGPTEPPRCLQDMIARPDLHLFNWAGHEAIMPDVVIDKFPHGTSYVEEWRTSAAKCKAEVAQWHKDCGGSPASTNTESSNPDVLLAGPDMSSGLQPLDLKRTLELETTDEVDFPVTKV